MKYVHYKKTTGEILGWYSQDIHGDAIPTPNIEVKDEIWQKAIAEGLNCVNSKTKKLSAKDLSNIDEIKEAKLKELKASYEESNQEDIEFEGKYYQADDKSQNLITSILSIGSVPEDFFWLDSANNRIPFEYKDLQNLSCILLVRNQQNFVKLQNLKEQVLKENNKTAINSIVW